MAKKQIRGLFLPCIPLLRQTVTLTTTSTSSVSRLAFLRSRCRSIWSHSPAARRTLRSGPSDNSPLNRPVSEIALAFGLYFC